MFYLLDNILIYFIILFTYREQLKHVQKKLITINLYKLGPKGLKRNGAK